MKGKKKFTLVLFVKTVSRRMKFLEKGVCYGFYDNIGTNFIAKLGNLIYIFKYLFFFTLGNVIILFINFNTNFMQSSSTKTKVCGSLLSTWMCQISVLSASPLPISVYWTATGLLLKYKPPGTLEQQEKHS